MRDDPPHESSSSSETDRLNCSLEPALYASTSLSSHVLSPSLPELGLHLGAAVRGLGHVDLAEAGGEAVHDTRRVAAAVLLVAYAKC